MGPGMGFVIPNSDGTVDAVFVAEFNPVGSECTGRFKNCTGSFIMYASSTQLFVPYFGTLFPPGTQPPPPQPEYFLHYSWVGEGTLTFAN
jgi:hypothetical protein